MLSSIMSTTPNGEQFLHDLATLGFGLVQRDRRGGRQFARSPNRFLTEWVHDDGERLLFTWEFDLGEYVASVGWQIGAAETSFQILYPQYDVTLPRDGEAVATEIARLEQRLGHLDLVHPDGPEAAPETGTR